MMNINRNNYESFFLLYIDRELNQADMQSVDHFLNENPDLQNEFSLLKKTVFSSSEMIFDNKELLFENKEMIFENKELLFRKEEKRRVIPMYWLRMAAAIAVLLMGSWIVISQLIKNHSTDIKSQDQAANVISEKKDDVAGNKMEKEKPVAAYDEATANGAGNIKTNETNPAQNNAVDVQTNSKSAVFNRQPGKNDLHEKNSSPVNAALEGDDAKSATPLATVQTKKGRAMLTSSEANASGTVRSAKSNATVPAGNSDPQPLIAKSDKTASEAASGATAMATASGVNKSGAQSAAASGVSESGAQSAAALATKSGLSESGAQSTAALAAKSGVAASGAQSAAAKSGSTESGGQSAKAQSALVAATTAVSGEAEYAVLNEQENQNAISVVALNEKNKAITGFFKKFTKRAPADERKKIRVSVFQFSL